MYLGKNVTPQEYYQNYSHEYYNAHSDAIEEILLKMLKTSYIKEPILDFGCGSGLITNILSNNGISNIVGLDHSDKMIARYEKETGHKGYVGDFWDELPHAKTAIASYSLHLCSPTFFPSIRWRLFEAGIEHLIVISPLKRVAKDVGLPELQRFTAKSGEEEMTIWGYVFGSMAS
jgi:SAM-dependent methyltransferase